MQNNLPTGDSAPLPYRLRRSERAKKTRIVVRANEVEVVAPLQVSECRIKAFVDAQQDWIRAALKRIHQRAGQVNSLAPAQYTDGVTVPYQGRQIPLTIKPTSAKTVRLQLLAEPQFLAYLPSMHRDNGSELIKRSLENWMKQQTRHHAMQLIAKHGQQHNLVPRNLRIKTLKSRWGSCGPQNDINLNWLLMLAPPVILEYVVVHELCHIKHKNHSKAFWQLVGEHMPDYLEHRHWLKQNGASLMQGL
ncbi:M48 family metallopeptidase [Methylomonas rapida]|uniref:SprT family zinc-dependent metalloprotease n=1 Tax=Methylomonas rapida TaxID=2963939 RepID=A0ABY7GLJ1_9GAMM|nr:SprT family zinc-dependent metalloprotease [Methylomonas rapida]WAR45375.1 SprT family zinc-dependent metalloprotease [Methylomonas rapida]